MIAVQFDAAALVRQIPALAASVESILVDELRTAAADVVGDMRKTWPRKTGRSAEGFRVVKLGAGARIANDVPYVPHVHRRGVSTLALDEITVPAIETAIQAVPDRAASAAQRRLA